MLYFDYCASAPIHPKVNQLMSDITRDIFANPSSMHKFGLEANELVEESRKCISQRLNHYMLWYLRSSTHQCTIVTNSYSLQNNA